MIENFGQEIKKIYVINEKNFVERRKKFESQFKKINYNFTFINDWSPNEISESIAKKFFFGNKLTLKQMSCSLKHVAVLKKIVEEKIPLSLIFEDDILISENFYEGLNNALKERSNYDSHSVIYLGCGGNFYTPRSKLKEGKYLYFAKKGRFNDSMLITYEAAKLRYGWLKKNKMNIPIDNVFDNIDKKIGVKILWLEPPIVEQGSKNGLFKSSLEQAPPRFIQKIKFKIEKLRRKYVYQLWR